MKNEQRRYLVVGPSWIGDMVMAQSLFITLRKLHPGCVIDVISPEWSLPLLKRMPEIRTGISLPVLHGQLSLMTRVKKGLSLRANKHTHAIVIPRSWKSALVPYFADVPVRTGYRGEMRYGLLNDIRKLDKQVLTKTVQRYVAHAYDGKMTAAPDIPPPVLSVDGANRSKVLLDFSLDREKRIIGMMPGAEYGVAKQWPIANYAELATKLVKAGYQVWVLGSSKDEVTGQKIIEGIKDSAVNLCGQTKLTDVVDLLSCMEQVVTNDSGLMHVAAAMGIQVNAIYGSSTPAYTPPLTKNSKVFYTDRECSPCFSRTCRYGHYKCLTDIPGDEIFSAIGVYSQRQEATC